MMNLRRLLTTCLLIALCGCASQNPPAATPDNSSSASAQSSAASAPPSTSILRSRRMHDRYRESLHVLHPTAAIYLQRRPIHLAALPAERCSASRRRDSVAISRRQRPRRHRMPCRRAESQSRLGASAAQPSPHRQIVGLRQERADGARRIRPTTAAGPSIRAADHPTVELVLTASPPFIECGGFCLSTAHRAGASAYIALRAAGAKVPSSSIGQLDALCQVRN